MICHRIQTTVLNAQAVDQAAYRPGFACEDHLLTLTLLYERCREWNQDLWIGVADVEKAFDTVEHPSLWEALRKIGVDDTYIRLLQTLYAYQTATVMVGQESRKFSISRGVKQGDPISGLLFLAVMEVCFRTLQNRWKILNKRRKGQYIGFVIDDCSDVLTNLRFADDVMLFAHSARDLGNMMTDFKTEAAKYGLQLHMGKTKALAIARQLLPPTIVVDSVEVEVLGPERSEKYLGRALNLHAFHRFELDSRVRNAWAAFSKFKAVFTSSAYPFAAKAKLFDAVVTPVMLYAAASWTLTKGMEDILIITQRRMLRQLLGFRRCPTEEWVEYIKRTTAQAETRYKQCGYDDWVTQSRRKKWRFARRAAIADDGRWSRRLLEWRPHFRCQPFRRVGRPNARWEDAIVAICGDSWLEAARDAYLWKALEPEFVER